MILNLKQVVFAVDPVAQLIPDNYFPGCLNSFATQTKATPVLKARGPALNEEVVNKVSKKTLFLFKNIEPGDVKIRLICEENCPFKFFEGRQPFGPWTFRDNTFTVKQNQEIIFSILFDEVVSGQSKITISVTRDANFENNSLNFTLTAAPRNWAAKNKNKSFQICNLKKMDTFGFWVNNVASPIITEQEKARMRCAPRTCIINAETRVPTSIIFPERTNYS